MPAKTLYQLSVGACIANIRYLFDVGEVPYKAIRPVLLKVENPQQLRDIEVASPQICGADKEVWLALIKRDIPGWESKQVEPKDPKNWYKVYRKLKREADEESTRRAAELKDKLSQLDAEKASQHITFDHSLTVPGGKRRIRPQQIRQKAPDSSLMTFRSGSKNKTTTGKSILQKARQEAREASRFSNVVPPAAQTSSGQHSRNQTPRASATASASPLPQDQQPTRALSPQSAREEALARRQRALAQQTPITGTTPSPLKPTAAKRTASSNVFMPAKKRRP